jgi:hypothetical protein
MYALALKSTVTMPPRSDRLTLSVASNVSGSATTIVASTPEWPQRPGGIEFAPSLFVRSLRSSTLGDRYGQSLPSGRPTSSTSTVKPDATTADLLERHGDEAGFTFLEEIEAVGEVPVSLGRQPAP